MVLIAASASTSSNIQTRQAIVNDLQTIVKFTLKLHQHEDDGNIASHINFKCNLTQWLTNELDDPRTLFLIAEDNREPVGFIGATTIINDNGFLANPIKGVIQLLWIEPEYRKNHLADKLVSDIEQCFKSMGIAYIECTYTASNQEAKSFWSKQAYKENSITARKFISNESCHNKSSKRTLNKIK